MARTLLLVLLCSLPAAALADPAADARSHEESFARLCSVGDVPGVMALYADDAKLVWPLQGQEATGKAAIEKLVTGLCTGPRASKFGLTSLEVVPLDDTHLVTVAHWEGTSVGPRGVRRSTQVRSTEVLVKRDGQWRYLVDHASIGLAPPRAAAGPRRGRRVR